MTEHTREEVLDAASTLGSFLFQAMTSWVFTAFGGQAAPLQGRSDTCSGPEKPWAKAKVASHLGFKSRNSVDKLIKSRRLAKPTIRLSKNSKGWAPEYIRRWAKENGYPKLLDESKSLADESGETPGV